MATRGELTTYVLERLGVSSRRTAFLTQIQGQLFREYVRQVRMHELLKDNADLVLVAGDPYVDLPDDFLKVLTVRISGVTLREVTFPELAQQRGLRVATDSSQTGTYRYVFMDPDRLYLDDAPSESSSSGTGEVFYVARPPAWSSDDDSPDALPAEFHDLLAERTIYRMAQNQEEFATHAAMALQTVGMLEAELSEELTERTGQGNNRVFRLHYG